MRRDRNIHQEAPTRHGPSSWRAQLPVAVHVAEQSVPLGENAQVPDKLVPDGSNVPEMVKCIEVPLYNMLPGMVKLPPTIGHVLALVPFTLPLADPPPPPQVYPESVIV